MKLKDYLFWFFFLLFWFGAGFTRAYLPPSRLQYILGAPEKVRILTTSKLLLPDNFLKALQNNTHTSIEIEEISDWDDFLVRCIAQPGYHAIFAPRHWKDELEKQGLIQAWIGLRGRAIQTLSPDFSPIDGKPLYFFPLLWGQTQLYSPELIQPQSVTKDIQSGRIKSIHFLSDEDLLHHHRLNIFPNGIRESKNRLEVHTRKFGSSIDKIEPQTIQELNHSEASMIMQKQKIYPLNIPNSKSLVVLGLYLPKNTPDKNSSILLLKEWLKEENLKLFIDSSTMASSFIASNKMPIQKERQSQFFRQLSFVDVYIPETHDPNQYNEDAEKLSIQRDDQE